MPFFFFFSMLRNVNKNRRFFIHYFKNKTRQKREQNSREFHSVMNKKFEDKTKKPQEVHKATLLI